MKHSLLVSSYPRPLHPPRPIEPILLWILIGFTTLALFGYATFGRHPQWLSFFSFSPTLARWLTSFYSASFRIFGEGQSWLSALLLVTVLWRTTRFRWLGAFVLVYLVSFSSELLGTTTGFPFGSYVYGELLGPKIFGHVPVVIPVSWFFMALPAYAISFWVYPQDHAKIPRVFFAAFWLSFWDLSLDPAMSFLTKYWIWADVGSYYGMPWINLFGWYITSLVVMAGLTALSIERWLQTVPLSWLVSFYLLNLAMPLGMLLLAGLGGAVFFNLLVLAAALLWIALERLSPARATSRSLLQDDPRFQPTDARPPQASVSPARATSRSPLQDGPRFQPTDARPPQASVSPATSVSPPTSVSPLARLQDGLEEALRSLTAQGMPGMALRGQMIRPLVALSAVSTNEPSKEFWSAALAVQMAHEASLLHDDILDEATQRRGQPTLVAEKGVAAALVQGDHLLTASYRAVCATQKFSVVSLFAQAVERTVAGEKAQAKAVGKTLSWEEYQAIVAGKSGELFGLALAIAPALSDDPRTLAFYNLGRRLGCLYQMLDDLLDYCPRASTGKPPFQDYLQKKWTWPLLSLSSLPFGLSEDELSPHLFRRPSAGLLSPMESALLRFEEEAQGLQMELQTLLASSAILDEIIQDWLERARQSVLIEVDAEAAATQAEDAKIERLLLSGPLASPQADLLFFARHSKTFRFASRFFPPTQALQVAGVYAFCRFTDDLVDQAEDKTPPRFLHRLLDRWHDLAFAAYKGEITPLPLLDRVMQEMAAGQVPFRYAAELIEGVRMDITPRTYADLDELKLYSFRVASVVGMWLTELFGIHDPAILKRAEALGHAMQWTNILRDVGEDLRSGRIYLPQKLRETHGLTPDDLQAMMEGRLPILPQYQALLEDFFAATDALYTEASPAIAALPAFFQKPVAVASFVYHGIHQEIRLQGYDNLRYRAHTSLFLKLLLAARALFSLPSLRQTWHAQGGASSSRLP